MRCVASSRQRVRGPQLNGCNQEAAGTPLCLTGDGSGLGLYMIDKAPSSAQLPGRLALSCLTLTFCLGTPMQISHMRASGAGNPVGISTRRLVPV